MAFKSSFAPATAQYSGTSLFTKLLISGPVLFIITVENTVSPQTNTALWSAVPAYTVLSAESRENRIFTALICSFISVSPSAAFRFTADAIRFWFIASAVLIPGVSRSVTPCSSLLSPFVSAANAACFKRGKSPDTETYAVGKTSSDFGNSFTGLVTSKYRAEPKLRPKAPFSSVSIVTLSSFVFLRISSTMGGSKISPLMDISASRMRFTTEVITSVPISSNILFEASA